LAASLAAFIALGSWLPTMAALIAIYAIAMLAIQADCAGRETLLSRLRFDRWSPLTYSCYMLHIPVATIVITFGSRLLSLLPHERLVLAPVAIAILMVLGTHSLPQPLDAISAKSLDASLRPCVPVFLFASGYLTALSGRVPLAKRLKAALIPCAIAFAAAYAYMALHKPSRDH